jgi:hypothetical protein
MPTRTAFFHESFTLTGRKVLRYQSGDEKTESVVIDPATVTADADGNKIVVAGSLLVKITASGAYGPYASGAADGRQTLGTSPNCVICTADVDVTRGPEAIGGWFSDTMFESANLTLFGATLSNVKAAFPRCDFL